MAAKLIEVYASNGAAFRRVTQDLAGIRVVTSDLMVHPDVKEYARINKGIKIIGYSPEAPVESAVDPMSITLKDLPEYLVDVTSVDFLMKMQEADPRAGARKFYAQRLEALIGSLAISEDEEDIED
jgi:hypothetical protein